MHFLNSGTIFGFFAACDNTPVIPPKLINLVDWDQVNWGHSLLAMKSMHA